MRNVVMSFDDAIEAVKEEYHSMEASRKMAWQRVKDYNKDTEVAKRDAEIERLRKNSLLIMSDKETAAYKAFIQKHYELHNGGKFRARGNTYQYELTGTGIGTVIKIKCPICGEQEDITDTDSW